MGVYNRDRKTMLTEQFTEIKTLLDQAGRELQAFNGGKKSAATRSRVTLVAVTKGIAQLRKDILSQAKLGKEVPEKPVLTRTPTPEPEEPEPEPEVVEKKPVKKPRKKAGRK